MTRCGNYRDHFSLKPLAPLGGSSIVQSEDLWCRNLDDSSSMECYNNRGWDRKWTVHWAEEVAGGGQAKSDRHTAWTGRCEGENHPVWWTWESCVGRCWPHFKTSKTAEGRDWKSSWRISQKCAVRPAQLSKCGVPGFGGTDGDSFGLTGWVHSCNRSWCYWHF